MRNKKRIEEIIKEFFDKMGFGESPEKIEIKDNTVSFQLETKNPEILIGKRGKTLINIQYLLAKILNKQLEEKIFVDFDINQYKEKKIDYLREVAKNTADEVALTKKEKVLSSMTPFERKIIHLTLNKREDVLTESQGEEPDRKLIIKPK